MVTVMVVRTSSGKPAKGEYVSIGIDSFFSGGVTKRELTDDRGEVHFPNVDPCNGEVYVGGRKVYKGRVEGRVVVYI
jgi:hypothetical protein